MKSDTYTKYKDLKLSFKRPTVWRRSTIDKLQKIGKTYNQFKKELQSFENLQKGATKEICDSIKVNIDASRDINELNAKLSELFEHYGKAIIPSEDIEPKFLLSKTNKNTLNKKLQPWCRNLLYNIPEVIQSTPYTNLINKFTNVPAFVCTAGPSLKNNMELLKEVKGKALIIAVDTSLRPLLEAGVVPDICVTHDANPNGCKFFLSKDHPYNKHNVQFNEMPDQIIGRAAVELHNDKKRLDYKYDTLGLFVNYCHPLTLLAWNGRAKRFYGVMDPSLPVYDIMSACTNYKMIDKKLTPDNKGRVIGGSSVGHVAAYIAIALGCDPISFLGLDLSYPGGKTYVEGASNQKDMSKQKLIEVDDLSGNRVKTNLSMLSYKLVFERTFPHILLQKPELQLYNCTEDDRGNPAGILEIGAQPKSLTWVIKNKCQSEVNLECLKT